MGRKYSRKSLSSSFTEDDIYFYLEEMKEMDGVHPDPLWYLHPSDEDDRNMTPDDYTDDDQWSQKTNVRRPRPFG